MSDSQIYGTFDRKAWAPDVVAIAIQDGEVIASHISSSVGWGKRDLAGHFPEETHIEWVEPDDKRLKKQEPVDP